jgi:hypothetical protein
MEMILVLIAVLGICLIVKRIVRRKTKGFAQESAERMELAIKQIDFSAKKFDDFLQQKKLCFAARPNNYLFWKEFGWWEERGDNCEYQTIPLWAAFIKLGFNPEQLAELFLPLKPNKPVRRWSDLGPMALTEENCQKLAKLMGRDLDVFRQDPYEGGYPLYNIKIAA